MDLNSLLAIIVIGIASNLDNAGVGVAYGVRKIHISWFPNFIIAFISFIATLLAGLFGKWVTLWITPLMGNLIGTIVIISIGIWVLCQPFIDKKSHQQKSKRNVITRILRDPEEADIDQSKTIGYGESILLGIALAMNALAGGFDAGVTNLSVLATSISVGLFSFLLLGLCTYIGEKYAAEKLGKQATVVAGILLILVGIHQMI
jgi:putative sporulation protein YtaF